VAAILGLFGLKEMEESLKTSEDVESPWDRAKFLASF